MKNNQKALINYQNIFYFFAIILIVVFYTYNYFVGAEQSTYLALINKAIDPKLYPENLDLALGSSIGELSPFYFLFKAFPSLTIFFKSDQSFFCVEVLSNLINLYFILKITQLFIKESNSIYLVSLILFVFIFDFPVFGLAKSGIGIHGEFSPAVFARPALIASIYYFFIGKYKFSMFLATFIGMLHFKEAWFISSAFLFFIIFINKDYKTTVASIIFMVIGLFPYLAASIDLSNLLSFTTNQEIPINTYLEKLEISENILKRERYEADLSQESISSWMIYALLVISAILISDKLHRSDIKFKLKYLLIMSLVMVVFGTIYTGYLYQFYPVPKLILLSPARSSWASILIATLILISYLYSQLSSQENINRRILIYVSIILLSVFPFNFIFIGLPFDFPSSRGWGFSVISNNPIFVVSFAISSYLILGIYLIYFIKKYYNLKNYKIANLASTKINNIFVALLISTFAIQGSYVLYSMNQSKKLDYYNFPLKHTSKKDINTKKLGEWVSSNLPINSMILGFIKNPDGVYSHYKYPYFTVISSRPYYIMNSSLDPENLALIKKSKFRIKKVNSVESYLNDNNFEKFQETIKDLSNEDTLTHIFVSADLVLDFEELYNDGITRLYKIN